MKNQQQLDLAIIGGGIGGVISLCYARRAGLNALLFEKQDGIGGLWRQLPAWQDIQINPLDWTLGDLPIAGPHAPGIVANIQAWVDRFDLAPHIRLSTPVTRAAHGAEGWQIETPQGDYTARYLIAATGSHNRAIVPALERRDTTVREVHSSALTDPGSLRDQVVVVVGGGASGYDLLDLCFENGASHVVWAYRNTRWMTPTRKPKHIAGGVRDLGRQQMTGVTPEQINAIVDADLRGRYEKFGLMEILPEGRFDFGRHQLIPGRRVMIENFQRIERHRAEVTSIAGRTVSFSDGATVDADVVLWGTGYRMDLGFFADPALNKLTTGDALAGRCGAIFRSLDAPDLFLLAGILEGTGSAAWAYAHAARSIMSHIHGKAKLENVALESKINYYDMIKFLATQDPSNFPESSWFAEYRELALKHPDDRPLPIP